MKPRVAVAFLTTVTLAAPAPAQDATAVTTATVITRRSSSRSAWAVGGAIGVPGHGRATSAELFTLAAQWTRFQARRPGLDVSLGVAPRFLVEGALAGGARLGAALPLPVGPSAFVVPSAGVSGLAVAGGDGGDGTVGVHAGGSLVLRGARDVGLRVGLTWHHFDDWDGTPWLLEVGVIRLPSRAIIGR